MNRRHLLAGMGAAATLALAGAACAHAEDLVPFEKEVEHFSIDERLARLDLVAPEAARRLRIRIHALLDAAEELCRAKKSGSSPEAVAAAADLLQDELTAMHGGQWATHTDHTNHLVAVTRRVSRGTGAVTV